jgi:hypothetical protein
MVVFTNHFRNQDGFENWTSGWEGTLETMATNSHSILPFLPQLEVVRNTASGGLWRSCPMFFGVKVKFNFEHDIGRGPKIPWLPMATQFVYPSQH